MLNNLCKKVLLGGGKLTPLIIDTKLTGGTGLMNPSIFNDDGELFVNIRRINYTLQHSEGDQRFIHRYGPLIYTNPENDMHLKTQNFLCTLNDILQITNVSLIDTTKLDSPTPLWEFHGLEDIRLVRWNKKLYGIGVRRDTTPNGEGRMELSVLHSVTPNNVLEVERTRIEPPVPGYCEKNWMPVIDLPYHFVKWSNPTQVVVADMKTKQSKDVFLSAETIPGLPDLRGGSQVIPWGDYRICCTHEVQLYNNRLGQKDGVYKHRFLVWDKNWNLVHISQEFSFMTALIEFCCGMCFYKGNLLISFGFQDNAAYILTVPKDMVSEVIGFKFSGDVPEKVFDWGILAKAPQFMYDVNREVIESDSYQQFVKVEEGDVVVDIGASSGPFVKKILPQKPKIVICLEPQKDLFETLQKNFEGIENVVCLNKGIADEDGLQMFDTLFDPNSDNLWSAATGEGITYQTLQDCIGNIPIDFLKCDCEGGEYSIFTGKNTDWIIYQNGIRKMVVEFHLHTPEQKNNFHYFKYEYLSRLPEKQYLVQSYVGEDLKPIMWDDDFESKVTYFMCYIDNTKPHVKDITNRNLGSIRK